MRRSIDIYCNVGSHLVPILYPPNYTKKYVPIRKLLEFMLKNKIHLCWILEFTQLSRQDYVICCLFYFNFFFYIKIR